MKKRIDGRTAKGARIRRQVRESLLASYIDLIRRGIPVPTAAPEIAERARLSLRAIFNHSPDLRVLRLASFNRMKAQSSRFFSEKIPDRGSQSRVKT